MRVAKAISAVPVLRNTMLRSTVRAAFEWLIYPPSSYESAAAHIDEVVRDTFKGAITWEKKSATLFKGMHIIDGSTGAGESRYHRLEILPGGRIMYHFSNYVYLNSTAEPRDVNVVRKPMESSAEDQALQERLNSLVGLVGRAANAPGEQID
jgi:hypothetical protein